MSIILQRYNRESFEIWNDFIANSKNGIFLFDRRFMDYHSDRFIDHSLMICDDTKLIAVFPANENDTTIYSHQGLTYGSLIMNPKIKTVEVLAVFEEMKTYYREKGFKTIIYKAIPHIFSKYPAQEDLYALFRNNAKLIRRDISSVIPIKHKNEFSQSKKNLVNRLLKSGVSIKEFNNYEKFWLLLEEVLSKYNTKPVHSLNEIQMLHGLFRNNIRLFTVEDNNNIIAGTVVFDFNNVIHTQYMANSDYGRKIGALDFINHQLINEVFKDRNFYSFGISTENNGLYLNEGLIKQKELMGGQGICLDFYEITL